MTRDDRRERLRAAGEWLRDARIRRGFPTAVEFARKLGIDKAVISNYERGVNAIDDQRAGQIAEALGMDLLEVRRGLRMWVPLTGSAEHQAAVKTVEDLITEATAAMDQIEAQSADQKGRQARAIRELIESLRDESTGETQDR